MKFTKCSCEFDKLDFSKIPLDCAATWDMIGSGMTKGVFQLEKVLGRKWSKRIKPRSIDELSDVISLIRPGCLEAKYREKPDKEGKFYSITETYEKIKNGSLTPEYIHPCLEKILAPTYGALIYQEQIMNIATELAGYNLKEADNLRKIVGKKIKEKMDKEKDVFVNKAVALGHDKYIVETIWGWILEFADYGFNKAHGVGYAILGYRTAYAKCHFPLAFFKAKLSNSDGKQEALEEIKELVNEAKYWGIEVKPPRLDLLNKDFDVKDGSIIFGLTHIKGVGATSFPGIKELSKAKDYKEFLSKIFVDGIKINSGAVEALIKSGSLDYLYPNRINLLKLFRLLKGLTDRELVWVFEEFKKDKQFSEVLNNLYISGIPSTSRVERIKLHIEEIKKEFIGSSEFKQKIAYEKHLLGMALSGSEVDIYKNPKVDTTCKNFVKLRDKTKCTLGVIIDGVRKIQDKNGNMMAFLQVSDNTYMLDGMVVFSRQFTKLGWIIEEGKPVAITGRKDGESFLVDAIEHL